MRRAFTLIELLVVVAIISILAALSTMAVMSVLGRAKRQATESTLQIVRTILNQKSDAFKQKAQEDKFNRQFVRREQKESQACGRVNVAYILAWKEAQRREFPQTWAEAAELLAEAGVTAPSTINAATESSEVLYFVLTRGRVTHHAVETDTGFATHNVRDTDGNGMPEIVDGWGRPLRFWRWPTRLSRGGAYAAGTVTVTQACAVIFPEVSDPTVDNDDPTTILVAGSCDTAANYATDFEAAYHTWRTYHSLCVMSAGEDGETGIYEPSDTSATLGRLAAVSNALQVRDNISTTNLKAGGK